MFRLPNISERAKLLLLSFLTGIGSGCAAVLLEKLISLIQNFVFPIVNKGGFSFIALVFPSLGMMISLLLIRFLIKDDIGHGVTKVLQAISRKESRIKPHNMWSSMATSAVTIGFGGSVGAEAPIVYTGAAIGSNIGRAFNLNYRNITILVGCGAAGAIAGIFKAPLAGILFTLEILFFQLSLSSMMPLLISTLTATVVSLLLTGTATPFTCTLAPFNMGNLPFYLVLGVFCGLFSLYFTRFTLFLEDKFSGLKNSWVKWLLCSIGVGLCILLFPPLFGEGYNFLGNLLGGKPWSFDGESPLAFLLHTPWGVPLFVLLVLLVKVISMTLTNAGGGVGGTFGPTLFTGALAGFVVARTISLMGMPLPEQNFVLVGMAGLMAGVMQAPMTAIFLIAEMTGGYDLLLPLILCSAVSFGVTRIWEKYSIYTKRIALRGELLTHDSDQAALALLDTAELVSDKYPRLHVDQTLQDVLPLVADSPVAVFPVLTEDGRLAGMLEMDDVRKHIIKARQHETVTLRSLMKEPAAEVRQGEDSASVMRKFDRTEAWRLPVIDAEGRYMGFISRSRILAAYRRELMRISSED